jgi:hypothetical protein
MPPTRPRRARLSRAPPPERPEMASSSAFRRFRVRPGARRPVVPTRPMMGRPRGAARAVLAPQAAGEGLAGTGGVAGQSPAPDAGGEPTASACNRDDACGLCLCGACREEFDACDRTPGCIEILACARLTGCIGFDCYCGSVDAITCGSRGRGNGPCLDATLAAPAHMSQRWSTRARGPLRTLRSRSATALRRTTLCISACRN